MKKFIFLVAGVAGLFFVNGCVESSQKYKNLLATVDTLKAVNASQAAEMENLFADLNDISAGMQSIREAEHLLSLETSGDVPSAKSKKQVEALKNDIRAVSEAINSYKEQITRLEKKNTKQSVEFKKLIAGLNEELEQRTQKINEIVAQLAEKDKQLAAKIKEITDLNQNVAELNKESASQKSTIAEQDQTIHEANYLVGTRKELKEAKVISRQGLFCPPIVSSQAQNADFKSIDIRKTKSIALENKKAKVLSVHPSDSYTLEPDENGMLILKIQDENAFWKQTKYLVIMIG